MTLLIINIFLFLSAVLSFGNNFTIKSLRVYGSGDEKSFPIIDYSGKNMTGSITIDFDIDASTQPDLKIIFRLCDKDWNVYDTYFLLNPGYNTENNLWFDVLPSSVEGARYHYKGKFPNENVTFPFSGQWKFFITDFQNEELIYAEGKFFVVYPDLPLSPSIKNYRLEGVDLFPVELEKTFEISSEFSLPQELYNNRIIGVKIIENHKINYPTWIYRNQYDEFRFYEWNASDNFIFTARDIQPGNAYRNTDLRDKNRFGPPKANAQLDGLETVQFFKRRTWDLNGGSVLTRWNDDWADYFDVLFKLRTPDSFRKRVFLVGAFNNWQTLPEYELQPDDGLYSLTIELKRGMYDYQFVAVECEDYETQEISWTELEGNFWETKNEYHVFLFYNSEEDGGYDKIIGYTKLNSGGI